MKGSKSSADAAQERQSGRRRYLTLFVWLVGICLSFGVYTLLVNALAHDAAGEAYAPPHSLAAPAQQAVIITPTVKPVDLGETFTVAVMIENASNLGAFEFTLTYDATCVVTATDVTLGPFLGSTGRSVFELDPTFGTGIVTYGAASLGATPLGPNGDGVLAIVDLEAGMTKCSSVLHLQDVSVTDIEGHTQSFSTEDGEVIVGPPEVERVTPNSGYVGQTVENVIVEGDNFRKGAGFSVRLTKSGESPISASLPDVQSSTRVSCTFNLGKAVPGRWTVRVTNPDGRYGELQDGFTVKAVIYVPLVMKNY
jgi:hypothetical protein